MYYISIRSVAPVRILKRGWIMSARIKKIAKAVIATLAKAVFEILTGVIVILITRNI